MKVRYRVEQPDVSGKDIKRAFEEIRWKKFNWIHSVQDEK